MTSLPVPPIVMLAFVVILLFLLGWPFEWPAIILVFLPIFYPVVDARKASLSQAFGIPPDLFMVWFGALVAVTMQTAYLSPPVAMSAYYLKQVVKEWSLGTIYKAMFELMVLLCIAIAGTWSVRWHLCAGPDVIPLWAAATDFRPPRAVLQAMEARVQHGVFGYT